jgi:sugar lactone lactonase YvrE
VAGILLAAWCQAQAPPKYTIMTVAGNGAYGYSGDAGPATAAQVYDPWGVAVDSAGNVYIADQLNNRVRKLAADGTISTLAGKGSAGYSGDGGAASSAELYHPCGVAVDSAGNVYIADTANEVVRKVTTGGTISTVAGMAHTAAYAGDGGAATSASLNKPTGVALDAAGNLYIADSFNHCIRMVATSGTITTVAGNSFSGSEGDGGPATSASLNTPQGVAVDGAGNLYIADTANSLVRKVAPDGTITTLAGQILNGYSGDGGPAASAMLNRPKTVLPDAAGSLYIADTFNSRIRVVTPDGTITTVAGNGIFGDWGDGGPATSAQLRFPSGLALDAAGNLYVADTQNNRVRLLVPFPQPGNSGAAIPISRIWRPMASPVWGLAR